MPVFGTRIDPSDDTSTPGVPNGDATSLVTARDLGIPIKPRYFLSELAAYVSRHEDDAAAQRRANESALRTLERECERRRLRGTRIGRNILVMREEWERYVIDRNAGTSEN